MNLPVKLYDMLVLIKHLEKGVSHPNVGFEDADRTLEHLRICLDKVAMVPIEIVESALWSCVLLHEEAAWEERESLDGFIRRLSPPKSRFNKDLCMWEDT